MYDELFAKVPDHPRLQNRDNEATIKRNNLSKIALLRSLLKKDKVVLEFAPGDCNFSYVLCDHAEHVIGVDISDQRKNNNESPGNFSLVIYDGYDLSEIVDNTIDVVFSDQLLEHFHVDDTHLHLETVKRILKHGGVYLFRTPHAYNGPHDVSKYFSHISEGFHLKEWTFNELKDLLIEIGYRDVYAVWNAKNITIRLPFFYFSTVETILSIMPAGIKRRVSRYLLPTIAMLAVK
jgi:SAM-dependent methyltransferase